MASVFGKEPAPNATVEQRMTILNQYIDENGGLYRIGMFGKVHYLSISTDVFDEDTMCRPCLLVSKLPAFPESHWTKMQITKAPDGSLMVRTTDDPLLSITLVVHQETIDVLSLERRKRYRSNVHETLYEGKPAVVKIAAFEWEMPRIANETWAYSIVSQYYLGHPEETRVIPDVLAQVTENGRVTGLLLEKVTGRFASIGDLESCTNTLRRLHDMGLVHGDANRYNFIVDEESQTVKMVDLEHAERLDLASAQAELDSLPSELTEETGRGRTVDVGRAIAGLHI